MLKRSLILWFSLALARAASAQPAKPPMSRQAQVHYERGATFYQAKDYAAAIAEFAAGYAIDPRREFLFAWAQAERLRGDCAAAIALYDRFLATSPVLRQADAAAEKRAVCQRLQAQAAPSPPPAEPPAERPPAAAPLPSGEPAASPTVSPSPSTAGASPPSVAAAPPLPARAPTERRPFYTDLPGDVLLGVGLATLGVGAVSYGLSSSDEEAAHRAPTQRAFAQLIGSAQTERSAAVVCFSAGAAVVAVGILRFALREHRTAVTPALARTAAALVIQGTF